jgi:indole-3-glycerol phosphate synthase
VILDEILAHKRQEVMRRRLVREEFDLDGLPPARGFAAALRQPGLRVIAEFKRRSPSGGQIRPGASPEEVAELYATGGASALSVLTDERYFGGSDADLAQARAATPLPVMRKDFVIDAYQVYEARAIGADAILLIVRTLSDADLRAFLGLSRDLGMDAVVESHSESEVEGALAAGAEIIGVNNRDLDSLTTDVGLAVRLRPMVPADKLFVAESGISSSEHMAMMAHAGVDAVLIGETLLRAADPSARLAELLAAAAPKGVSA